MNTRARTVTPQTLMGLDHNWMTRAACARRLDLPWTEDAHRVPGEPQEAMAHVCRACPVGDSCRRFAEESHASAAFWAGGFRDGGDHTADVLHLLAALDDEGIETDYDAAIGPARKLQREAVAR